MIYLTCFITSTVHSSLLNTETNRARIATEAGKHQMWNTRLDHSAYYFSQWNSQRYPYKQKICYRFRL